MSVMPAQAARSPGLCATLNHAAKSVHLSGCAIPVHVPEMGFMLRDVPELDTGGER